MIAGRKNSETNNTNHLSTEPKPIHYVQFQTAIITLANKLNKAPSSTTNVFNRLMRTTSLFKKIDEQHSYAEVNWLHGTGYRRLRIVITKPDTLDFYDDEKFLSCKVNANHELEVTEHRVNAELKKQWNDAEKKELINNCNEILGAKTIIYSEEKIVVEDDRIKTFDAKELDNLSNQYRAFNITYRVNQIILHNSRFDLSSYHFYLSWTDSANHSHNLEAKFSRTMHLNSRTTHFVNEKSLCTLFPEYQELNPGQYYYQLEIYDDCDEKKNQILNIWFSTDAKYGELMHLEKGNMSGNDVLEIFKKFHKLFGIKNTIICDASKLTNADDSVKIFLRVISAIATGKTWYESKLPGLKLFECEKIDSVHFDKPMSQNIPRRAAALTEVQQLPLSKWRTLLDEKQQKSLRDLSKKHSSGRKSTLKTLTTKVYDDAKSKKELTADLVNLAELIYEKMPENFYKVPDKKAKGFLVKSNVYKLLWESYYWVLRQSDEKSVDQPSRELKLNR